MTTPPRCPQCGGPMQSGAVGIPCPRCLLGAAQRREPDADWVAVRLPHLTGLVARSSQSRTGGFVRIFDAHEFETGTAVSVFLAAPTGDPDVLAQRLRVIDRYAAMDCPGIARLVDAGEIDGFQYAIEERPAGKSIARSIGEAGVGRQDMLRIVDELDRVTRYASARGISLCTDEESVYISNGGEITVAGAAGLISGDGDAQTGTRWAEEHPAVGTRIGPYSLKEKIGEGGFAEVYRARQEVPFQRDVALKILKVGMDSRQMLVRFDREREALSMLSHSRIATIYDAGVTGMGRPYITMELVDGVPISAYCDSHRLSLRGRAALLAEVCHAVEHGHQKGLVHRDLKPSNALIGEEDGHPVPKVIDFGIARVADEPLNAETFFTRTHQLVGTPCYMSPEQIDGANEVDARSDVYSLGCLLYELLAGSTPITETELGERGLKEILDEIETRMPPHPADRVASLTPQQQNDLATHRSAARNELARSLRGEISDITLKALAKQPERRYASAAAMAEDIDAWIAGNRVSAGRHLRKGARRLLRAGAVATVLAAAGLSLYHLSPWDKREPTSRRADGSLVPVSLYQFDGTLESSLEGIGPVEAIGGPDLDFVSTSIRGEQAEALAFPRFLANQWLRFPNRVGVNGPKWATESNHWTLVIDVMSPAFSGPMALFQCHTENGGLAEMYIDELGIGTNFSNRLYGNFDEGRWYRIAVVANTTDRAQHYTFYVNGTRWGGPSVSGKHSAQRAFDDEILLFCDGDQHTCAGLTNSVAVYDVPLTDAEIAALGPPSPSGIPESLAPAPSAETAMAEALRTRFAPLEIHQNARFGTSIASKGDELWVGAPGERRVENSIGSIYRFRLKPGESPEPVGMLASPVASGAAGFGNTLALGSTLAVVADPGTAWLYHREDAGRNWLPPLRLHASANSGFEFKVALIGEDVAAVAQPNQTGGRVSFYSKAGAHPIAEITPPTTSDSAFGICLGSSQEGDALAIGFARGRTGCIGIYTQADDGWSEPQILDVDAVPESLTFSPDGTSLAVIVGNHLAIFDLENGSRSRLKTPWPKWSSEGCGLHWHNETSLYTGIPYAIVDGVRGGALLHLEFADGSWRIARTSAAALPIESAAFGNDIAAAEGGVWIAARHDHREQSYGGAIHWVPLTGPVPEN